MSDQEESPVEESVAGDPVEAETGQAAEAEDEVVEAATRPEEPPAPHPKRIHSANAESKQQRKNRLR